MNYFDLLSKNWGVCVCVGGFFVGDRLVILDPFKYINL